VVIVSNDHYNAEYADVVVAAISSTIRSDDQYSVMISDHDLEYGILPEQSCVKVHKLFTIDKNRIIKKFSLLKRDKFTQVFEALKTLFSEQ